MSEFLLWLEALDQADAKTIVRAVGVLLDGQEWGPDTFEGIVAAFELHGWTFVEPAEVSE